MAQLRISVYLMVYCDSIVTNKNVLIQTDPFEILKNIINTFFLLYVNKTK